MISSKLHFHSGAKRCIPAVWPGQRVAEWAIISLLLFHFSPSVFIRAPPEAVCRSRAEICIRLFSWGFLWLKSTLYSQALFLKHTHSKGQTGKVNQLWKVGKCDPEAETWCELSPVKLLKTAEADVNWPPSSPLYTIIHSKNGDISALMLFAVGWRTFRPAVSGIGWTHHLCPSVSTVTRDIQQQASATLLHPHKCSQMVFAARKAVSN